jgi:hydrogenase expression/formation protein HypC
LNANAGDCLPDSSVLQRQAGFASLAVTFPPFLRPVPLTTVFSMCLALPGLVEQIDTTIQPVMGKVNFGGVRKSICLELVPEVKVGNYVIVHVGFALNIVDEAEALETIRMLQEMGEIVEKDPPTDAS